MNGKCLEIGTIQAFLDGETRPDEAVAISEHVADCDACAILLAQAEEESSLVFSVLDRELNTLVPTQRLWTRINAEIAEEKSHSSIWQRFFGAIVAGLANPSFAAAAGILLVVGVTAFVLTRNSGNEGSDLVAGGNVPVPVKTQTGKEEQSIVNIVVTGTDAIPSAVDAPAVSKTEYTPGEIRRKVRTADFSVTGPKQVRREYASAPQYLPGEESYIRTINELQQTATVQRVSTRASTEVAFQRDLAVVEDSIKKLRQIVRKNPRNQAARQVLYSSYQDKIDLLKSSTQRDELMASFQ